MNQIIAKSSSLMSAILCCVCMSVVAHCSLSASCRRRQMGRLAISVGNGYLGHRAGWQAVTFSSSSFPTANTGGRHSLRLTLHIFSAILICLIFLMKIVVGQQYEYIDGDVHLLTAFCSAEWLRQKGFIHNVVFDRNAYINRVSGESRPTVRNRCGVIKGLHQPFIYSPHRTVSVVVKSHTGNVHNILNYIVHVIAKWRQPGMCHVLCICFSSVYFCLAFQPFKSFCIWQKNWNYDASVCVCVSVWEIINCCWP